MMGEMSQVMDEPKAETQSRPLIPQKHGGALWPGQRRDERGRNPKGRPKAGAVVAEWLDIMADWTIDELREVLADRKAPAAKVQAAIDWIASASEDKDAAGHLVMSKHADRIHDRTVGKPQQQVNTSQTIHAVSLAGLEIDPEALRRLPPEAIRLAYTGLEMIRQALAMTPATPNVLPMIEGQTVPIIDHAPNLAQGETAEASK